MSGERFLITGSVVVVGAVLVVGVTVIGIRLGVPSASGILA